MAAPARVYIEEEDGGARGIPAGGNIRGRHAPAAEVMFKAKIKVIGIGGGGNNALDHIIRSGAGGVEFLAVNTDAHCLEKCLSVEKLVIGEQLTKGRGAGARPEIGEQSAIESREQLRSCLKGCDMVYLAAGMGGGTGTGALPVVADIAKELGILTVAVVTRPFSFEGKKRTAYSDAGIERTKRIVDALIVVPNDRLLLSDRSTTVQEAFAMADGVLCQAVQGVTDLVTKPGMLNVDFADLRSIMKHSGGAVMGVGSGKGDNRAEDALKSAMESPLMECSIKGAKGVILNITGGADVGLHEMETAIKHLEEQIDPAATFIWGLVNDEMSRDEEIRMVVIATGYDMDSRASENSRPDAGESVVKSGVAEPRASAQKTSEGDSFFAMDSPIDTPSYFRRRKL
ncbi:MAG: cell division protein FtsZ [Synergistaceae bacterium]|nr:cell division protein FtsZ [Synergistaceae bacterium]